MKDHNELLIASLYTNLLQAWNNQSAENFAALFTKDANVVGFDGSQMNGRKQIQEELETIFKDHRVASYTGIIREIKPLGTVYLLRAVAGMVPPGGISIKEEVNTIQSLLAKEEDGHFLICFYQNTPAAFHSRKELSTALTQELQAAYEQEKKSE